MRTQLVSPRQGIPSTNPGRGTRPEGIDAVDLGEVSTPYAVIDERRIRCNILSMQAAATHIDAELRPHFKTHRMTSIARMQQHAGACGFTVSTAHQLAAVGETFDSPILLSSPIQVDPAQGPFLREAAAASKVLFSVESRRSIEALRQTLGPDVSADVMIEVEAGCRRCGVPPRDCGDLARFASRLGLSVVGAFTYPGQAYLPGEASLANKNERRALGAAAHALLRAGVEAQHLSAGCTPTMRFAHRGVVTEYRPGTYVFGDRQQIVLGSAKRNRLALTVVATVLAAHRGRLVLDAGGKALGRDAPPWLEGHGELVGTPTSTITRLYDHHAVIENHSGAPVRIGDRVGVIPNNANSVLALHRSAWLSPDGTVARMVHPESDQ